MQEERESGSHIGGYQRVFMSKPEAK